MEVGLCILKTLNMFKAHTADDTRSIFDGSHAVSIVWVLALGNQITNRYSIGDRTRTVNECFEAASDFNSLESDQFFQVETYIRYSSRFTVK